MYNYDSSFASLCEAVTRNVEVKHRQPLLQDVADTRATSMYSKSNDRFWQELCNLANADPEGLGSMLGVDANIVSTWYGKIQQVAKAAKRANAELNQDTMVKTGVSK